MNFHVDNIVVCTLIERMLSTTSLYEIHIYILILSLLHVHSCTMEDNPLLVDMCLVVMLISLLTPSYISCLYIEVLLCCINPIIWLNHSPLIIACLSWTISWASRSWHFILALGKFLHGIKAIGVSLHSHWRYFFCRSILELFGAIQIWASHSEGQKTP